VGDANMAPVVAFVFIDILPPSLYLFRKVSPVGHQLLLVSMS
jgi:hypothetical protein